MRTRTVWTGIAALSVVFLAACSSGGGTRSAAGGGSGKLGYDSAGANAGGDVQAPGVAPQPADGRYDSSTPPVEGSDVSSTALLETRALIRTASISVRVKDISTADRVRVIALGAGGLIVGDDRSSGEEASAALVLEVPPGQLENVLAKIAGLGEQLGRQQSTKDVTTQVADVNSRVESAKDSIAQLRLFFARAKTVAELIAIESELSRREADLESLQAQQRSLAAQTDMARVTVELSTTKPPAEKKKEDRGFIGGIKRGWDNFTDATVSVLTGLGIVGPFVVFLALLGGVWTVLVRRRRIGAEASATAETT